MLAEMYRCERCHEIRRMHKSDGTCPDGKGKFEQRPHKRGRPFASQSFTGGQVDVLAAIVQKLLEGNKDLSAIARSKEFPALAGKILRMKQRVERIRSGKTE